jgi:hypothetical protein
MARVEDVGDVEDYCKNHDGRIEKRILERGFRGRGSFGNHGFNHGIVPKVASFHFNRNRSRTKSRGKAIHSLAGFGNFA